MADLIVMKGVKYTLARLKKWLAEDGVVWADTKRDEFRCLVTIEDGVVRYLSASGKTEHENIPHELDDVFLKLSADYNLDQFDCGLMVNNSFDLTRRVLRSANKPYDLTGGTHHTIMDGTKKNPVLVFEGRLRLEVFLYDLPERAFCYMDARELMNQLAGDNPDWLRTTAGKLCDSPEQVDALFEDAINGGHEGLMVKRVNYDWTSSRTSDWMKMKPEDERDGIIVGWNPGTPGTEFEGLVGSVIVEFVDGSKASCSGMTAEVRKDMTEHFVSKYLNRIAEVHFMQRDTKGGYRHPNFYRLHPDKTNIDQCD
ncbi:DNA ligase [Aeromonas phage ST21]|uniref:DNA ligase n=1 Tax=Aeromonas phage ST21 TaxID=3065691 RepID=A0AA96J1A2_9CAUD|nr:DNA ligase [Aeromonas phage ST21]